MQLTIFSESKSSLFQHVLEVILILNTRGSVSSGYPNTEKSVENTRRSGVFLMKFKVFG